MSAMSGWAQAGAPGRPASPVTLEGMEAVEDPILCGDQASVPVSSLWFSVAPEACRNHDEAVSCHELTD